jgi:GNAT superfamily N-acetyltransferase
MEAPAPFVIREAEPADAPGILDCLAEAFAPYESAYTPGAFADTVLSPATLRQRMARMTVLAAKTADGTVAGTIAFSFEAKTSHIRGMAVLDVWQGTGLAAELLAAAESGIRRRGGRRITLDTTAPLTRAIAFYRKHGYAPTGQVQDFFGMPLYEFTKELAP